MNVGYVAGDMFEAQRINMEEEFLQSDDKLKHKAWTWYDN